MQRFSKFLPITKSTKRVIEARPRSRCAARRRGTAHRKHPILLQYPYVRLFGAPVSLLGQYVHRILPSSLGTYPLFSVVLVRFRINVESVLPAHGETSVLEWIVRPANIP
jgi:hypothetical protein